MKTKSKTPWYFSKKTGAAIFLFVVFQLGFRKLGGTFEWIAVAVMDVITFIVFLAVIAFAVSFLYRVLFTKRDSVNKDHVVDLEYGQFQSERQRPKKGYGNEEPSASDLVPR